MIVDIVRVGSQRVVDVTGWINPVHDALKPCRWYPCTGPLATHLPTPAPRVRNVESALVNSARLDEVRPFILDRIDQHRYREHFHQVRRIWSIKRL